MSHSSDLVHASRLEVHVQGNCVRQTVRSRRSHHSVETWEYIKQLGQGGFGEVHLQRCADDGHQLRAVKKLTKTTTVDYNRALEAAALFSQKLYDGVFVQSLGWYETARHVFLTMEYLPFGDLRRYMHGPFTEPEAQTIARQILEGLNFMHERDFVHRDLKPENILIHEKGPQWWIKLADFGISKRARDGDATLRTHVHTPQFAAPEVLFATESYTRAVDIWSTGITAFLLLTGEKAVFNSQPELLQYWQHVIELPTDRLLANNVSGPGRAFIASLLSSTPKSRPNAAACLQHVWLQALALNLELRPSSSHASTVYSNQKTASAMWTTVEIDNLASIPSPQGLAVVEKEQTIAPTSLMGARKRTLDIDSAPTLSIPATSSGDSSTQREILASHRHRKIEIDHSFPATANFSPKGPDNMRSKGMPIGEEYSRLCLASARGQLATVKMMLGFGVPVNHSSDWSALCAASREGHARIVEVLLDAGADITANDGHICGALRLASLNGHTETVMLLLDRGAENSDLALVNASTYGQTETVKALLDRGTSASGLHYALANASRFGNTETVKLLKEAGARIGLG